jgi:hypothetical protein
LLRLKSLADSLSSFKFLVCSLLDSNGWLDPLIHFGFFELTVPNSPTSPNQKYRLTGKFVRRIQKN